VAVGQTFSDIEGDNVTRNFVYTDSGNLPGEKHVVIMALVKVQISATEAGAGITQTKGTAILTIGGSSRTIDVYTPPNTDRSRPTYVTVMHSARVTGQVVNCSIQMRSDNATYHANVGIYSPTIHVSRVPVRSLNPDSTRSGGFFYAWRKYDLHNWLDCGQRQYPDGYWHKFYSGRLTHPRWVLVDFPG
jgi:hypothetical protein